MTIPSVGKDVEHWNADPAGDCATAQVLWETDGKFPLKHTTVPNFPLRYIPKRNANMCPPTDAPRRFTVTLFVTVSKWKQPKGPSIETTKGLWKSNGVMRTVLNKQLMTAHRNTDAPLKQNAERNRPDTHKDTLSEDVGARSKNRHN